MEKLIKPGRCIFIAGIVALAIYQAVVGKYLIGRPPIAEDSKTYWVYISSAILIIAAIAIILRKRAGHAALVIALTIFVYSFLLLHLPAMTHTTDWEGVLWSVNAYKTLALVGGALIVAASCFREETTGTYSATTDNRLILTGAILIALFMVIGGLAHFKFTDFVQTLIPEYIPAHAFWTKFTAVALLAGGVGLVIKPTRKWAAFLSGVMILLWFFLLHLPRANATPKDNGEWLGVMESFTFSGMLFVLAGLSATDPGYKDRDQAKKI